MQRLSDVKDNELVKNKTFDSLKTKVNNLEKNISDATTSVHINQCSIDKQSLEKKLAMLRKNTQRSGLVATTALNTKISKVENKIIDHVKFISTQKKLTLMPENFATRLKQANLVRKTDFDNKLINSKSNDGSQNTFFNQPTLDTLKVKKDKGIDYILGWKSKVLYTSRLKPLYTASLLAKNFLDMPLAVEQNNLLTEIVKSLDCLWFRCLAKKSY